MDDLLRRWPLLLTLGNRQLITYAFTGYRAASKPGAWTPLVAARYAQALRRFTAMHELLRQVPDLERMRGLHLPGAGQPLPPIDP